MSPHKDFSAGSFPQSPNAGGGAPPAEGDRLLLATGGTDVLLLATGGTDALLLSTPA